MYAASYTVTCHNNIYYYKNLQVAALAPLALLCVLEARCTHFIIVHFINIVCCGVVHHALLPHSTYQ